MRSILSRLSLSQKIPHFRIHFPLQPAKLDKIITALNRVSPKSPAMFLSVYGLTENAELSHNLRGAFQSISAHKKVPLYSFLEDNINGLTYYVATAANQIHANPFCRIGDLTTSTKSYHNIHGLLTYLGIDFQSIGTRSNNLWDPNSIPSQNETATTAKWRNVVSQRLATALMTQRNLDGVAIQALRSKLLHPKKALQLKLINSVSSLEQFRSTNFPNNSLAENQFSSKAEPIKFTKGQLQILAQITELLEMPEVILTSMEDPISLTLKGFAEIILSRLGGDEFELRDLDILASQLLHKLRGQSAKNMLV